MEEIHANTWEHFEEELAKRIRWRDETETEKSKDRMPVSEFLFRGQSNAEWKLETTLDRRRRNMPLEDYYLIISRARPKVEAFTEKHWNLPSPQEFQDWLTTAFQHGMTGLPGLEYWIYLRHHGFPSPLLDWTTSPYVAAFFAFKGAVNKEVSIYMFIEYLGHFKTAAGGEPSITTIGPYVRTHKRHFLQKSQYTWCTRWEGDQCYFGLHEEAEEPGHDRFWKFVIPVSQKTKVLTFLDQKYNINDYSLFGSEESLMNTIAMQEFS